MPDKIVIPTIDVPINADFLFFAKKINDILGTITDFSSATFTVTVYTSEYPNTTTTLATLTGSVVTSSTTAHKAVLADTDTSAVAHGTQGWASLEIDAGAGAKSRFAYKLNFVRI